MIRLFTALFALTLITPKGHADFYNDKASHALSARKIQQNWVRRADGFRLFGMTSAALGTVSWAGHVAHRIIAQMRGKSVGNPRMSIALTSVSALWTTCSAGAYKYGEWLRKTQPE